MEQKKLKVGIIGFGFIGKVHAHCYHAIPHMYDQPGALADIHALLRTSRGRDIREIEGLGNPKVLTDIEEFAEFEFDIVDICTPNFLHLDEVRSVLEKGAPHIYCEKPLGLNLDHAEKITALAKEKGVQTHTAFMNRYYPAVHQAKAVLEAGAIGEIYNFRAHYFHNSYMDPQRPISWLLQKEKAGGGAMADLGIHIIDLIRYLLGDAEWVQGYTRTFIHERPVKSGSQETVPVDVDDWGLCMMGMKNGSKGFIETTRMSGGAGDSRLIEIFGSRGSIEVDMDSPLKANYYNQDRKLMLAGDLEFAVPAGERPSREIWPAAKKSLGPFKDAHTACIYDFLLNIVEEKESGVNFENALKAQEILEAIYLSSAEDSRKIELPLI